jgi:hypothetical protein
MSHQKLWAHPIRDMDDLKSSKVEVSRAENDRTKDWAEKFGLLFELDYNRTSGVRNR